MILNVVRAEFKQGWRATYAGVEVSAATEQAGLAGVFAGGALRAGLAGGSGSAAQRARAAAVWSLLIAITNACQISAKRR